MGERVILVLVLVTKRTALLAQLAEHRSYEPKVTGSTPVGSIWEHGIF